MSDGERLEVVAPESTDNMYCAGKSEFTKDFSIK